MEILELINSLEELVIQARRLPVGGNLVIDRKRILDIIDQMRLAVPDDIKDAQEILDERDGILEDARQKVRATLQRTEDERNRRLAETSILQEAQARSNQILQDAEARSRQTIAEADAVAAQHLTEAADAASKQLQEADDYALAVLQRLDQQLDTFLGSIRTSIGSLQQRR